MNLVLYKDCIPVKGHSRSVLCDLTKNHVKLIPNSLHEILTKYDGKEIEFIKKSYNNLYDDVIDDYITFLLNNDYAFIEHNPDYFPKLNLEFENNSPITNCIIDCSKSNNKYLSNVFEELKELGCLFIQIRFYELIDKMKLINILEEVNKTNSTIISLDIIMPYCKDYSENELLLLIKNFPRLMHIVVYNFYENKLLQSPDNDYASITFTRQKVYSEKSCGIIKQDFFVINLKSFSESINFNSCLNKKISIDANGNIKNCPSMPESYGNIKDTTLQEAINKPGFKKYWNITKDDIEVCKDCEFRYVCTDCRAYTERTKFGDDGLDLSKPLKCGYNPYTNEWAEWSTNPLKQKAIEYYGMQEIIDNDKN